MLSGLDWDSTLRRRARRRTTEIAISPRDATSAVSPTAVVMRICHVPPPSLSLLGWYGWVISLAAAAACTAHTRIAVIQCTQHPCCSSRRPSIIRASALGQSTAAARPPPCSVCGRATARDATLTPSCEGGRLYRIRSDAAAAAQPWRPPPQSPGLPAGAAAPAPFDKKPPAVSSCERRRRPPCVWHGSHGTSGSAVRRPPSAGPSSPPQPSRRRGQPCAPSCVAAFVRRAQRAAAAQLAQALARTASHVLHVAQPPLHGVTDVVGLRACREAGAAARGRTRRPAARCAHCTPPLERALRRPRDGAR
jgi:hypothetical protein